MTTANDYQSFVKSVYPHASLLEFKDDDTLYGSMFQVRVEGFCIGAGDTEDAAWGMAAYTVRHEQQGH